MKLNLKNVGISLLVHLAILAIPLPASALETKTTGAWTYGTEPNSDGYKGATTISTQYNNMMVSVFCNIDTKRYSAEVSFNNNKGISDGDIYLNYQVDNRRIGKIKLLSSKKELNKLYVQKNDIDVFLSDLITGNRIKFKWPGVSESETQYPIFSLVGSKKAIRTALSPCFNNKDNGFTQGKDKGFVDSKGEFIEHEPGKNVF